MRGFGEGASGADVSAPAGVGRQDLSSQVRVSATLGYVGDAPPCDERWLRERAVGDRPVPA